MKYFEILLYKILNKILQYLLYLVYDITNWRVNTLKIDKREVLRYLGYRTQKLPEHMDHLIDNCLEEMTTLLKEMYVYRVFSLDRGENEILLPECSIVLRGRNIENHLKRSCKCAVMAVTLGLAVDQKISLYGKTDLTRCTVLDACATAAVEVLCDKVEEKIKNEAATLGFNITTRFSPGYGDLSLNNQKNILASLDAYARIGLSVTESQILIPRKSVTAIIGFQNNNNDTGVNLSKSCTCSVCTLEECQFKKGEEQIE
jgi:hypothetical protein